VIAGPTAVGKSSVASVLCDRRGGEVISADSVQVYRGLDIGSAKPSLQEQETTRHHLVDVRDISDAMAAGDYARLAKAAVDEVLGRGRVPVLVGGSTMWMDWITSGIPNAAAAVPEIDEAVAELVAPYESKGRWDDAINDVAAHIPDEQKSVFLNISRNNWVRLKRYLVIDFTNQAIAMAKKEGTHVGAGTGTGEGQGQGQGTGKLLDKVAVSFDRITGDIFTGQRTMLLPTARSGAQADSSSDSGSGSDSECNTYDTRQFFLYCDRELLYRKIECRCEDMLRAGILEEVGRLVLSGSLQPEHSVCKAIGYRQIIEYLCRENFKPEDFISFFSFLRYFAVATRNYAKAQFQWYRKRHDFLWMPSLRQSGKTIALAIEAWCALPREEYQMGIDLQVRYLEAKSKNKEGRQIKDDSSLDQDVAVFLARNPTLISSFDVEAREFSAEDKKHMREHIQTIGFLPSPTRARRRPGKNRRQPVLSPEEEADYGRDSEEVTRFVNTADALSLQLRERPELVRAFQLSLSANSTNLYH
jgi:tRNA dimethylallyltransferase